MRTLLILGGLAVCVLLVTPSHGDRTEDGGGKMKTMDSESRRLAKRDAPQQVCCPRQVKERENCKPCSVRIGRRQRSTETAPDGEMKTMDSESRRLAKRDVSKQVCCPRWGRTPNNCKRCRTPIGRGHHTTETTPDGEMKKMDSESRKPAKRKASKQVCCPPEGPTSKNCKRCQGKYSLLGRNFVGTETTPDEEVKTMDSESRILAKRDAPQQVCCPPGGKKPENCKRCRGGNSLIGRNYVGTETTPDEEEAAQ